MAEKPTTKLCKYCKTEIPYDAKICPNCKKSQKPNGCLIAILVVVVLFVLVGIVGGSSGSKDTAVSGTTAAAQPDSAAGTQAVEATPEPKTTYTVGESAEDKDIKVTLVSAKQSTGSNFLTPADGNVYVMLEFEIENNSSTDIAVSSALSFEAYCDDYSVNMDLTANLLDDSKKTLDGDVAAGKKLNGVIGYEVPADFEKLEVKFTPSFWSNRSITFEIPNQ